MKTALSIAGSDSCAGAGIQADLKTMAMNGVYATTAITALTAQNTTGVAAILDVPPEFLAQQLDAVFADIPPDAVKTGMIPSAELMRVAAQKLAEYGARNVVIDPVMAASSGSGLMQSGALAALTDALFPLAALITPNIPEAQALSGKKIDTKAGMEDAARQIGERFGCAVLLKGGHLGADASDVLYANGTLRWFAGARIANPNSHGTGCTLSSAIAANLAKGFPLEDAVARGREYLRGALATGLNLGRGSGPLDHTFDLVSRFAQSSESV